MQKAAEEKGMSFNDLLVHALDRELGGNGDPTIGFLDDVRAWLILRYGDDVTYHGRVVGFSGGTGAAFAIVPAQNATGNWIKVVQRLPVRIKLDPRELAEHPLRVGLSMNADIKIAG